MTRNSGMLRFDVFGRALGIARREGEWRAYYLGSDGKRREAREVVIPPSVPESELPRYLTDLFHESATPEHPEVVTLDGTRRSDPAGPGTSS